MILNDSQLPLRLNFEVGAPGIAISKPPTEIAYGFSVNATATTIRYSAALLADPVPLVESLLQAFVDELSLQGPIGEDIFSYQGNASRNDIFFLF